MVDALAAVAMRWPAIAAVAMQVVLAVVADLVVAVELVAELVALDLDALDALVAIEHVAVAQLDLERSPAGPRWRWRGSPSSPSSTSPVVAVVAIEHVAVVAAAVADLGLQLQLGPGRR